MTEKKVYLEWMRVAAILLVIFNHLPGYELFLTADGVARGASMLLAMLARINVPLFFMVSGAVLLDRQEDCLTVLKKRVLRIAAVIVIFSAGLYLLHALYFNVYKGNGDDYSLRRFLRGLLGGGLEGAESYWFLYAYLGYLLLLPFLQRAARGMSGREFSLLIALHALIYTIVPLVNLLLRAWGRAEIVLSDSFSLPLAAEQAFFYPLIGYYLDCRVDIKKPKKGALLAIGLAAWAAACLCAYANAAVTGAFSQRLVRLSDYALAIPVFLLIKRLVLLDRPSLGRGKAARAACLMGALCFGVYLLDPYLKLLLWGPFHKALDALLPVIPVSLLWVVFSFALGGALSWGLKKLPVFRQIL